MSSPKEPCYFVEQKVLRRVWPGQWEQGYWRSVERYLSLFADAGGAAVIAEASTFYSQEPRFSGVAERILSFNPSARFVYIMRDPIERTVSHYWHRVRWWGERREMLSAIRSDPHYRHVSPLRPPAEGVFAVCRARAYVHPDARGAARRSGRAIERPVCMAGRGSVISAVHAGYS
jgi:hypothetical protein